MLCCNVLQTCHYVDFVNFTHSQFYTLWIFTSLYSLCFFFPLHWWLKDILIMFPSPWGENAFDSIFKCDDLVHHCAQCLAIAQSHCLSIKLASSEDQTVGIFLINSLIGRTPQSASKHDTISNALSNFCTWDAIARNISFSLFLLEEVATRSATSWQECCQCTLHSF